MSGGHLLCADRSGTKTHCGGVENVAEATRRRRRILQNRILFLEKQLIFWEKRAMINKLDFSVGRRSFFYALF
mgnify:CR=1 FL=1